MNESYSAWKEKRGRKTEIWVNFEKYYISINQTSSHVIKMPSKKAALSETERSVELWHEEESLWNVLSDNYKIRQGTEKKCWKNVGKTRNYK